MTKDPQLQPSPHTTIEDAAEIRLLNGFDGSPWRMHAGGAVSSAPGSPPG